MEQRIQIDVNTDSSELAELIAKFNAGNITIGETTKLKKLLNAESQKTVNILSLETTESKKYTDALGAINKAQSDLRVATKAGHEEYFRTGLELRQRTLPAMTSFSQIIQDSSQFSMGLSQGVRSIGNNVEFMTQQMVMMRAQGMSMSDILKGMASNIMGPGGILLGVSLLTTGLTFLTEWIRKSGNEAKEAGSKILEYYRNLVSAGDKGASAGMIFFQSGEVARLQKELDALVNGVQKTTRLGWGRTLTTTVFGTSEEIEAKRQELAKAQSQLAGAVQSDLSAKITKLNEEIALGDITRQQALTTLQYYLQMSKNDEERRRIRLEILQIEKDINTQHKLTVEEWRKQTAANWDNQFSAGNPSGKRRGDFDRDLTDQEQKQATTWLENQAKQWDKHFEGNWDKSKKSLREMRAEVGMTGVAGVSAIQAMTNAINTDFRNAWQSAFGEANSLLEIFAQSFAETMTNLATKYAIMGALNMLFPGGGSFITFAASALGVGGRTMMNPGKDVTEWANTSRFAGAGTMQPIIAPINIGGTEFGEVLIDAYGRAVYRRQL